MGFPGVLTSRSGVTVDGKNPAPFRMPQMLGFPHYQSLFGHPKWLAGIFFLWAHFDEKMGVKL